MFLCYYVAWPCDLDLDLLTLRVSHVQCFSCPTQIPIFIILRLSVTELPVLNILSFPLSETVTANAPCHVTSNVHIFEIPDLNLPIHFVTLRALRRRLSHVIGKNSVFPLWRLESLLRMRSITWPVHRRSPKTTRNTFLGLRWRLMVVYIRASPC